MNAVNNEQYVVAIRRENDTQGTLSTYAFYTPEEACKFAENKRAEVSFDMEPKYSLVKIWDADGDGDGDGDGDVVSDLSAILAKHRDITAA